MTLPFPNVEFQEFLTEIGALEPEVVYVFFAGGGAVEFVKDYAAAGLKDKIVLLDPASSPIARSKRRATRRRGC